MSIHVRHAGSLREVAKIHRRRSGLTEGIRQVYRKIGGVWYVVFGDLEASMLSVVKPAICVGAECPTSVIVTATRKVTASGGTGREWYLWTFVSGDPTIQIDKPAAASVKFSAAVARNTTRAANWNCKITDGFDTVNLPTTVSLPYTWTA